MEASGRLVGPPVFKTGERPIWSLAGSIPVRLRHAGETRVSPAQIRFFDDYSSVGTTSIDAV